MADEGILGLLGRINDPSVLYQGALTDPATKQALAGRGLLAMAGSFADSAMPTRMPTPFGAVLGHAAAAAGASGDAVMDARLKAAQGQQAMANVGLINELGPAYQALIKAGIAGGSGPAPGVEVPGTIGAPTAATAPVDAGRGPLGVSIPPGTPTAMMDPKLSGSENLNNLIQAAAPIALPPGYKVEMISGARPGATVAGGGPSQHATAEASDFQIRGPDGKIISNKGEDTTGYYGKLALTARMILDPALKPWLAWGGNFSTAAGGNTPDLMHFDWAGDRGHLGTLEQMERNFATAQNGSPGGGAPPPGVIGGGPSTVRGSWFGNAPGWTDKTDRGIQANGQPVSAGPGIALPIPKDSPNFGGWYDVTAPNGQTLRLQQTDVGPGPQGKGRGLDVNAIAAGHFGYTPSSFPTDGSFRIAPAGAPPPRQTAAAPGAPGGLLNVPDLTGRMNAPIPGIPGGAAPAPGAPGPVAPAGLLTAAPPGPAPAPLSPDTIATLKAGGMTDEQILRIQGAPVAPGPGAAAGPPLPPGAAGAALVAAQQRNSAPGAIPRLPPGLVSMADASGQVPIPAGPNLVRGGAIPGGAPPPPAAPPVPPPGPPQSLIPPPPAAPPVPPAAMPQPPPVVAGPPGLPAAPTGPPVAPPINLPPIPTTMPPMPGGMGAPIQPSPQQQIAQGIVGISSLTGHPAPDFMQKLAGQPVEMQMERYKAWVGAQANMMTEQYKKQIEVAAAGTISYLQSQGTLPADLTKMTTEQNLRLRNEMLVQHGLVQGSDGNWKLSPEWLDSQGRKALATAQGTATGTNIANLGPTNPMGGPSAIPPGAAPPANEPAKGTASPYGMIPPLSEQKLPASAKEADAAIPLWQTQIADWTKGVQPAQQAELRLMTIAQAFKSIQTGTWTTEGAALTAALRGVGVHLDPNTVNDPAKVQLGLHENILTTLPILKAATPRPSQTEFVTTSENREHPNIQPEANLQMLAEDIALMRQAQHLPAAYNMSGWQNPLSFETAYLGRNKLAPMVDAVKQEIGPLKGMPGWTPPGLPPGATDTGKTHNGKPIYEYPGPDGKPIRGTLQ